MKIGNAESRVENSKVDKKIGVIMLPKNVEHIFFSIRLSLTIRNTRSNATNTLD